VKVVESGGNQEGLHLDRLHSELGEWERANVRDSVIGRAGDFGHAPH
jgi:hypothetical protein